MPQPPRGIGLTDPHRESIVGSPRLIPISNTGSGTPTHRAREGTFYWDTASDTLYINNDGATGWERIANASDKLPADDVDFAVQAVTISSGSFTLTGGKSHYAVSGQGGADDVLTDVAGGADGQAIIIQAQSEQITLAHLTGSAGSRIYCPGGNNLLLPDANSFAILRRISSATGWFVVSHTGAVRKSIIISGAAMKGGVTDGAGDANRLAESAETSTNKINYDFMRFSNGVTEKAYWPIVPLPGLVGTTIRIEEMAYVSSYGSSGNVRWTVNGRLFSDSDPIDSSGSTATVFTTAHSGTANDLNIKAADHDHTPAGSGHALYLQLRRTANHGDDTVEADVLLLWMRISYLAQEVQTDAA